MKLLSNSYLCSLICCCLLGTCGSWEENSSAYDNGTSSDTHLPANDYRRDLLKNQLIREVYADVKTMLRYFPDVTTNISATGRSLIEMRHFIFGCMSQLKAIRNDVTAIKHQMQQLTNVLPKNLSSVTHEMDIRDRAIMQAVRNNSRSTKIALGLLSSQYAALHTDYEVLSNKLNNFVSNQNDTPIIHTETTSEWPMIEQNTNRSITNMDGSISQIEQQLDATINKLQQLLSSQTDLKNKMDHTKIETDAEIAHLETKVEVAFTGLTDNIKVNHNEVINEIRKISQHLSELKQLITSISAATPYPPYPSYPPPTGKNYQPLFPRISYPRFARFSPLQIFKFLPLANKAVHIFQTIKKKKPILGVAGAIGVGKFLEAPKEIKDMTGVFGGLSGLAMLNDTEFEMLQELALEIPALIGLDLPTLGGGLPIPTPGYPTGNPIGYPTGPPIGYPSGYPIGYPSGDPIGYPTGNPVGYPAGHPTPKDPSANPVISIVGNPRPADRPPTTPSSWFPALPDLGISNLIDNIWPGDTNDDKLLPTEPASLESDLSDEDPDTVAEIIGLPADVSMSPGSDPTPQMPDDEHPTLTGPPMPTQPPPIISSTPMPPERPTLLQPLTIINSKGLEGDCACSCPCDCTCPILPMVFPKKSPEGPWWAQAHRHRPHGRSLDCHCLCACPCPAGIVTQVPSVTAQTLPDVIGEKPSSNHSVKSQPSWMFTDEPMADSIYHDPVLSDDHYTTTVHGSTKFKENEDCPTKIGRLAGDIQNLREEFKVLKITVRDEMVITRVAIMNEMAAKFREVTTTLAGLHHANLVLHANDKNATDNVTELVKGQFAKTGSALRHVGGAINKMSSAVEDMLNTYYHEVMDAPQQPYVGYRSSHIRYRPGRPGRSLA